MIFRLPRVIFCSVAGASLGLASSSVSNLIHMAKDINVATPDHHEVLQTGELTAQTMIDLLTTVLEK